MCVIVRVSVYVYDVCMYVRQYYVYVERDVEVYVMGRNLYSNIFEDSVNIQHNKSISFYRVSIIRVITQRVNFTITS